MEYRLPKKTAAAALVSGALFAGGLALLILSALRVLYPGLHLAAALVLFCISLLFVKRYLLTDYVYRLGEEYASPGIDFFLLERRSGKAGRVGSRFLGGISFEGNERLLLLDKKGRRALKGRQKCGSFVSNFLSRQRYALLYGEASGDEQGIRGDSGYGPGDRGDRRRRGKAGRAKRAEERKNAFSGRAGRYVLIEAEDFFLSLLQAEIDRAARLYGNF